MEIISACVSANEFGGEDQFLTLKFPDGTVKTIKRVIKIEDRKEE